MVSEWFLPLISQGQQRSIEGALCQLTFSLWGGEFTGSKGEAINKIAPNTGCQKQQKNVHEMSRQSFTGQSWCSCFYCLLPPFSSCPNPPPFLPQEASPSRWLCIPRRWNWAVTEIVGTPATSQLFSMLPGLSLNNTSFSWYELSISSLMSFKGMIDSDSFSLPALQNKGKSSINQGSADFSWKTPCEIFSFADSSQLQLFNSALTAEIKDDIKMNKHGCVPITLYLWMLRLKIHLFSQALEYSSFEFCSQPLKNVRSLLSSQAVGI